MQPAGIRDVARRAGVSVATVSNVFNRPEVVASPTRQRVLDAVNALGYIRNESARHLRLGQSRTVGLIVPDIANPFFTDVARGVEDVVRAAGSLVIVCNTDDDREKERQYITLLAEEQVQGVLTVPVRGSRKAAPLLRDRNVPVVLLDSTDRSGSLCSVAVDDVTGGRIAVAHLLEQGHRRVGFIGSGYDARQVIDRLSGARTAMSGAGHDPQALITFAATALTIDGGVEAARAMLAMPLRRRPTGVACVNDLMAFGVMQELLRSGLRVPEDVAIVGYDDIGFAVAAAIPLSSVRQPRQRLGEHGAKLLLAEAAGNGHRHESVVFRPDLIVRASSDLRRRSAVRTVESVRR